MIQIIPIPAFNDNYIWLLHNASPYCAVVDPGDAVPVLHYLSQNNLRLAAILLTHHHRDHCAGVATLLQHYQVPVYGPACENISTVTRPVSGGDRVELSLFDSSFEVIHVPGHTLGHVAYYGAGSLFCGDTLFLAGCGRLFEGSAAQLYGSLSTLAALPLSTQVYCGHEYTLTNLRFAQKIEPANLAIVERIRQVIALRNAGRPSVPATLAEELATNPFLRCHLSGIKAAAESLSGLQLHHAVEVFQALRDLKDNFKP